MNDKKPDIDFEFTPLPYEEAVNRMIIPGVGIQASDWIAFKDAIFGRDTLRFIRDLMPQDKYSDAVRLGILSLAKLQAREPQAENPLLDATIGGIHHEARLRIVNGRRISPAQEERLNWLAEAWGSDEKGIIYYGSTDTTPDFITAIGEYCQKYGKDFLNQSFTHELTGEQRTIQETVVDAVEWILDRIEKSPINLVESHRTNPRGLPFPFWRDGKDGYRHPNGQLVNALSPIASFEVQTKAYEGLIYATELLADYQDSSQLTKWHKAAKQLQQNVLTQFWMPNEEYFGMAIDRDPASGSVRLVNTISSLPGETLASRFWLDLDKKQKQYFVSAIVKQIFSARLLTEVGVRCMDVNIQQHLNWFGYQGPTAVWAVSDNMIEIGLRKHGLNVLAEDLENRTLNSLNIAGNFFEHMDVLPDGRVNYDPLAEREIYVPRQELVSISRPEHVQAWTASAVARIVWDRSQKLRLTREPWQKELEDKLLSQNPPVHLIQEKLALAQAFPRHYGFKNNINLALLRKEDEIIAQGYSEYNEMI